MPYGSSYKNGNGVGAEQSTAPERPASGSGSPMRGVTNPNLPSTTIDDKRNTNNTPVKFPEDLADDFYISFNTFKHSQERPQEAKRTFVFEKSIVLPLPANLTDGNSAGYSAENLFFLGNAGKELATSLMNEKGIGGAVSYALSKQGLNAAAESITQGMNKIAANPRAAAETIGLGVGVNVLSGTPGVTAAAAKSALQLSANPFPVMIFQGTSFKPAFSFDWVLYPESRAEANDIKKIIGFFRKEMLPERDETNTSILKTPAIFEIKIVPKGIARTFKRCVLTNMGVNYAPSGPSFITDVTGNREKFPTAVALSLTFQEIEVWLANDYTNSEDSYFDPNAEFQ
jgi:hypothetical protein